ncbi:Disease resistance protein RPP2A, partial [Glycine soja]
ECQPGSRIIVTTRNKQILSPIDEIYQVQDLSSEHSLQFFCLTVFGEIQPKDGYEDQSRRAISYCKGLDRDWVTSILEAYNFFAASGIKVLSDLGRRSRLWKLEEVQDVLKYDMGTDAVEGITLDLSELTWDLYLSSNSLAKLSNMRFLKIHDWCCTFGFNVYLSNGLDSWDGFSLDKLKKLWDGVQQIDLCGSRHLIEMSNLSKAEKLERKHRFLYLSGCKNLDSVGNKLLSDDQHNASNLLFLKALLHNIGYLVSLRELDLRGTSVESLPANIQNLSMLTTLWLDDCRKLMSLPKLPPYLEQLRAFNCTLLETDTTQRLVLQHMLQSSIPSYMHKQRVYSGGGYFILAGDHVTNECWLHAAESSITIPCLHS